MKFLGFLLFLYGVVSTVLFLLGRELKLLTWINNWGPEAAWGIRIGFIVLGALLMFAGGRAGKKGQG